ncbi:MAG: NlpC/P60 family protein [Pleurocapsa sp. MO_226.B13]|nr:NlpC/P60 family protein [Pleurocapsa sp. MO_226.B13]
MVSESAQTNGLTLDSATIDRMLAEEGRSQAQKDALAELKELRENRTKLAQYKEQLAQNIQSNRNALIDFNRTISDYFFRINQQIKEATLEGQRLLSQVFYTDVKNRLRSAIAPGSNTFVNGIIDNIQSVIDQASQVAQKVFGDKAAQLGFESETRTLATEMQDFIRQIGNAGDAVERFTNALNGVEKAEGRGQRAEVSSNSLLSKEGSDVAKNALSWQGKHFREGVYAMCAGFVRQVLKDSGIDLGVTKNPYDAGKQPHNGELMARSFFGSDIGTVFKDKSQAKPGDIIGFFDTYQYGQKPGAITHVGIYQGNNMMVDRSTSSAPVRHRSIDTFGKGNYIFVRPHAYQDLAQPMVSNGDRGGSRTARNNIQEEAVKQNQKLLALKQANLEITKATTQQEREALAIQVEQTIEANKRQIDQGRKENARNLLGLESKFADFGLNYDYQSAEATAESALRQIKQQFLDADLDIANQIRNTEDAIATIKKTIPTLTNEIAKFKAIGTPEALAAAKVSQASLDELTKSLPELEANLEKIKAIQENSAALEDKYTEFVESQNQLKIHQEQLNKRNLLLTQQATIAEARGTVEAQRQVKAHQEDLRLALRMNELRQQYADGEFIEGVELSDVLAAERRQSQINQENINYDSQLQELDLERKLLDYQTQIDQKKAGFMSRFGLDFNTEKLKRDNAIATENLRFERELIELRKQYQDQPELLEELARRATELNSVNLRSIENEFKSLGNTVQETFITATQGFFNNFTTGFFDGTGQREKAELEERLRYAEELVNLENQYREQPGKLAHLKNRARELNEQKLDKINNEFNIFKRGVDIAKQALLEFTKQLAAAIAQAAAAKFISSILGTAIGGATGGGVVSDFGSPPFNSPLIGGDTGGCFRC